MKKIEISWNMLDDDVRTLAKMIMDNGWDDCDILAISRGGLVPASMLSHYTSNQHIEVIGVKGYSDDTKNERVELWQDPYPLGDFPEKLLIVDDIVDSGDTLRFVENYIQQRTLFMEKPIEINIAVLYDKDISDLNADMFVKYVPSDNWIVFPWED